MRAHLNSIVIALALLAASGCAVRDEIIAAVPEDGAGGGGGDAGLVLLLSAPVEHPLSCGDAGDAAVGDVDGDGVVDVLVGGECLNVFRGDGVGALGASEAAITTGFGAAFAVGFVDSAQPQPSSGSIDVVAFSQPTQIYLGDGNGGFDVQMGVDAGPAGEPGSISLANVYGDDALDLITSTDRDLSVWVGDGVGAFLAQHMVTLDEPVFAHAHGDLDGDTHADLLALTKDGIYVLLNLGDNQLAPARLLVDTAGVRSIVVRDLNGDDCPEVLAIDGQLRHSAPADGRLLVLRNHCDGNFSQELVAIVANAVSFAVGDMDADGAVDVVVARGGAEPAITTARGRGDGTFGAMSVHPLMAEPGRVLLVDLDDDARTDVVATRRAGSAIVTLRNETP